MEVGGEGDRSLFSCFLFAGSVSPSSRPNLETFSAASAKTAPFTPAPRRRLPDDTIGFDPMALSASAGFGDDVTAPPHARFTMFGLLTMEPDRDMSGELRGGGASKGSSDAASAQARSPAQAPIFGQVLGGVAVFALNMWGGSHIRETLDPESGAVDEEKGSSF